MTLHINTASPDEVIIALAEGAKIIAQKKFKAPRQQGERLVSAIAALLRLEKINLGALKKIVVADRGGSFTSLRIGVITANALAYALGIPVQTEGGVPAKNFKKFGRYRLVEPVYDRRPNIGKKKDTLAGSVH